MTTDEPERRPAPQSAPATGTGSRGPANAPKKEKNGGTVNEFVEVICPACWKPVSVRVDPDGGGRQEFVVDCEVCCQAIQILVTIDPEGWMDADAQPIR